MAHPLFNAFERRFLDSPECDGDIYDLIKQWDEQPQAIQVFRVVDEIKVMRAHEALVPFAVLERLDKLLDECMKRENITYKDLNNRALWRDQDW